MSDAQQTAVTPPTLGATPSTPVTPPAHYADNFLLQISPGTAIVTLGMGRPIFTGVASEAGMAIEWVAAFSLSPTVLKQLAAAMTEAVGQYEKQFGKIPTPPSGS
jgi:hypothetical protein